MRPLQDRQPFVYDDIIARIADPLFFQITAFLFFEKIFAQISGDLRQGMSWCMLGHYMKRILALYTAWFVIYAPVVLPRTWQECGNIRGMLLALLKKYWLSGYYGAMWFMTALLLSYASGLYPDKIFRIATVSSLIGTMVFAYGGKDGILQYHRWLAGGGLF